MKLSVIQNAFENVKKFSQEKLVEKYPNGVPEAIQKRYLQELTFLENSDCIDDFREDNTKLNPKQFHAYS